MLILDGGEYSTYPEFKKLKDRTTIFVLDDTNTLKCMRIRQELLTEKYQIIYDNLQERNGCSIFRK